MISRIILIVAASLSVSFGLLAQHPTSQATTQPTSQPASQPTTQPSHEGGKMSFEKMFLDIGEVKRGEVREFEFPFTNTGDESIKIDLVSSCDCTTTKYPTKEIKPGEKASIEVKFDSTEKEESETIDIDIFLTNSDPKTGSPIIVMLQYKYELLK